MKNNEVKRMYKFFTISEFDKEEEFLREQHRQGFRFVRYCWPGYYYFEACTPEDVVYQLDFNDAGGAEAQSYRQMFADHGWEYICRMNGFNYFRKAVSGSDEDFAIYSDMDSKIDRINNIMTRRMMPILMIFTVCLLPQLYQLSYGSGSGGLEPVRIVLIIIFSVLILFYVYLIMRCLAGLSRLRKAYSDGEK